MKTTIRAGSFETNSSSTHSLTVMTAEDYAKYDKGEAYVISDDYWFYGDEGKTLAEKLPVGKALTKDEILAAGMTEETFEEGLDEHTIWFNGEGSDDYDDELDESITRYTSPSGDELVIICRYGWC